MLRNLFRKFILSISLGAFFIQTPLSTSQASTQIPAGAMQLEDLTPKFLTSAMYHSYHNVPTLVPLINATQTVPETQKMRKKSK